MKDIKFVIFGTTLFLVQIGLLSFIGNVFTHLVILFCFSWGVVYFMKRNLNIKPFNRITISDELLKINRRRFYIKLKFNL